MARTAVRRIPWRARPCDRHCASCQGAIAERELVTNYIAAQWAPGRIRHWRCTDEPVEVTE